MGARQVLAAIVAGAFLVACNPSGLHAVGDSGDTATASDTGDGVGTLIGILVEPDQVVVPLGGTVQLTATGLRDDRTSVDVTAAVDWVSDAPSVATVSTDLDHEGLLSGAAEGQTDVFASLNGIDSVPASVRVTSAALQGLTISPEQVTVEKGQTARLRAQAAYSDGSRADASAQVIWVTGDPSVETLETGGKLNAVEVGSTTVHAELDGQSSKNVPVSVIQGAKPDLTISSLAAETGQSTITVNVSITNQGSVGASDFWVDVFLDPDGTPAAGAIGDDFEPVFYADAGETVDLSFQLDAEAGSHAIWVVVDGDDAVTESDETNNTDQVNAQVGAEGGNNLTIHYFDYYADSEYILYFVDVYNGGTESVGPFWVDLWYDQPSDPSVAIQGGAPCMGDDFQQVDLLGPGETAYLDFTAHVAELDASLSGCASCASWVMADTCNAVDELHEDDNVAGPLDVEVPAAR